MSEGSITLPERLERIEKLLERMDEKLDQKADAGMVHALESSLEQIRTDPYWVGRSQIAARFDATERAVSDLVARGSIHAQQAERSIEGLGKRVNDLETDTAAKDAVQRYRNWLLGGALFVALNTAISVLNFVHSWGVR